MKERLSSEIFRLPIEKIRAGYKADKYFLRSKTILEQDNRHPRVTMQLFHKVDGAIVCGTDHTLAILQAGCGHYEAPRQAERLFQRFLELEQARYKNWLGLKDISWEQYQKLARESFEVSQELDRLWVSQFPDLKIKSLNDGDPSDARETIMLLEGDLASFIHLETLYLGVLTDETCVATNAKRIVEAAEGTPILMFGARHKSHESQATQGYAALISGISGVSTDEQGEFFKKEGLGTIPHALIAAYDGDTGLATLKFDQYINSSERQVNVISLTDFDNDNVGTSLSAAKALNGRLWGVRLDTSENMVDRAIWEEIQNRERTADRRITGVTPRLVFLVREALDKAGFTQVKIVASGGFTPGKIKEFKQLNVPVDVFGVGSAFFAGAGGEFDYTADVVRVNGKNLAKVGRFYNPNPRLKEVNFLGKGGSLKL